MGQENTKAWVFAAAVLVVGLASASMLLGDGRGEPAARHEAQQQFSQAIAAEDQGSQQDQEATPIILVDEPMQVGDADPPDEYEAIDHESSNYQLTYKGYDCTVDCSGHRAGYNWADRRGIDDENDCEGNSNSFREGCLSYVEEQRNQDQSTEEE